MLALCLAITLSNSYAAFSSKEFDSLPVSTKDYLGGDDFKYGQYVYVTLKDGSQTVGKIVGKKSSKKYYVNQLDRANRGLVHKKYIRKMTKEEIEKYKSKL